MADVDNRPRAEVVADVGNYAASLLAALNK
jgi:hypothetical protein